MVRILKEIYIVRYMEDVLIDSIYRLNRGLSDEDI